MGDWLPPFANFFQGNNHFLHGLAILCLKPFIKPFLQQSYSTSLIYDPFSIGPLLFDFIFYFVHKKGFINIIRHHFVKGVYKVIKFFEGRPY